LLAGVLAGCLASLGALAIAVVANQPSLVEELGDAITEVTPIRVVVAMIQTFGPLAKRLLLVAVLLGQIGVGALLGASFARRGWSWKRRTGAVIATLATVGLVALPLFGQGVLGSETQYGAMRTLGALAVVGALYLICYEGIWAIATSTGAITSNEPSVRRGYIRTSVIAVGSLALGFSAFRWLAERPGPAIRAAAPQPSAAIMPPVVRAIDAIPESVEPNSLKITLDRGVPGLATEITPNDELYAVSKNLVRDPAVNSNDWRLTVGGLVERPASYRYDEIRALPAAQQYFTMQCVGNPIGGDLIGNAQWTGISVASLLKEAGVKPSAFKVVFHAADRYADSILLAKAMEPDTMLAYEMNGAPLPQQHGFPARLILPDIYGQKNVKWVTGIEVVDYDFKGYWEERGWDDTVQMHTTSRIDLPKHGAALRAGPNFIGGIAVAGARGISRVEVSVDGGMTWAPATVKSALGPSAWILWLYDWDVPQELDRAKLVVRATDGAGTPQIAEVHEDFPEGVTGYHSIEIRRALA
jgi:DMSO/TMAO reductase YedYZ molybdopterin-dependent catalytic subunit